jgi:hypothetical protein
MKLGSWFFAFALFALLVVGVCFTYVRRGTTVIGDFVSPSIHPKRAFSSKRLLINP